MEHESIGPRFSRDLPSYHALAAFDVEAFTTRVSSELPKLVKIIPRVLKRALERSGLVWGDRRFPESTGDGYVFGLPVEQLPRLLDPFLDHLQQVLEEESNKLPRTSPALRMRVSIHLGPLPDSGGGSAEDGVGRAMNDLHRLLDSEPPRDALRLTDPDVTFVAAVVSQRVYADVIEAGYSALKPSELTPVRAEVKQFSEPAYLYVPRPSGRWLGRAATPLAGGTTEPLSAAGRLPALTVRETNVITIGGGKSKPDVYPVPTVELDLVRTCFVAPPGTARASEVLRARHVVVLVAEPGGRRATALHLLNTLARRSGISIVDVVKHWSRPAVPHLPLHTGCGYVLSLNDPVTDLPTAPFAEDLRTHAHRLVDLGSYLVIITRPSLWRQCAPAAALTVPLGRPDPNEVLAAHLARLGLAPPSAPRLPSGISPRQVVEVAELSKSGLTTKLIEAMSTIRNQEFLLLTDPDQDESVYPLRDDLGPRTPVSIGRAVAGAPAPDIVLATGPNSWVSRDEGCVEYAKGAWWFQARGRNQASILRRGATECEPIKVNTRHRIRHGDVIQIRVQPDATNHSRGWRLEFRDPNETRSAGNRAKEITSQGEAT